MFLSFLPCRTGAVESITLTNFVASVLTIRNLCRLLDLHTLRLQTVDYPFFVLPSIPSTYQSDTFRHDAHKEIPKKETIAEMIGTSFPNLHIYEARFEDFVPIKTNTISQNVVIHHKFRASPFSSFFRTHLYKNAQTKSILSFHASHLRQLQISLNDGYNEVPKDLHLRYSLNGNFMEKTMCEYEYEFDPNLFRHFTFEISRNIQKGKKDERKGSNNQEILKKNPYRAVFMQFIRHLLFSRILKASKCDGFGVTFRGNTNFVSVYKPLQSIIQNDPFLLFFHFPAHFNFF